MQNAAAMRAPGARFAEAPSGAIFPLTAVAGIAGAFLFNRAGHDGRAFLASGAYLLGMMTGVVFGVYPYVLPSNTDPSRSLTIYNAAAPEYGLRVRLMWWFPAILLVSVYFVFAYRHSHGRIDVES